MESLYGRRFTAHARAGALPGRQTAGRMPAEKVLSEYDGKWSDERRGVVNLKLGSHYETQFSLRQNELFDPEWMRDPVENQSQQRNVKSVDKEGYYRPKLNFDVA